MGSRVELSNGKGRRWTGTVVPRSEVTGDRVVQLKLESGYNIGVRVEASFQIRLLEAPAGPTLPLPPAPSSPAGSKGAGELPWVALLTTGGTIASRVDYETGGVRPVKDEREILSFYPELESAGKVRIVSVFDRLSEDITPEDWTELAHRIAEAFGQ
ncbi:MAG: asparaginase domain-containing protein, partial [Thermoplasmata archaeon]